MSNQYRYTDLGVIVGRFQVSSLHKGHLHLINEVLNRHRRVLICVGVPATFNDARYPLPFEAVSTMLQTEFSSRHINVVPIVDERTLDGWSRTLDRIIGSYLGMNQRAVLYGGRDSFLPLYEGRWTKEGISSIVTASGTEERASILEVPDFNSSLFRAGIIYAHLMRPHQTYETVDVLCYRDDRHPAPEVLLGRKPGQDGWRLPGGFVEPNEPLAFSASRELSEETGISLPWGVFQYVTDLLIPDWRFTRHQGISLRTHLFKVKYQFGATQAADDLEEVKWFPASLVRQELLTMIVPEHQALVQHGILSIQN